MVKKNEMRRMGAMTHEIAARIDLLTSSAGITQSRLAGELSRSQSYVSVRMIGDAAWTTDDVDNLARILGLEPMYLLLGEAFSLSVRAEDTSVTTLPRGSGVEIPVPVSEVVPRQSRARRAKDAS